MSKIQQKQKVSFLDYLSVVTKPYGKNRYARLFGKILFNEKKPWFCDDTKNLYI
jgi:hypothetical protein